MDLRGAIDPARDMRCSLDHRFWMPKAEKDQERKSMISEDVRRFEVFGVLHKWSREFEESLLIKYFMLSPSIVDL